MIAKLFAILITTFLETIRQPIFGVILLLTALMMALNVSLAGFTMDDDNKLLQDVGLSTLLMSGLFLAAFSASGVLTREIDNKTVLTVISKPVSRPLFILGKFLGLSAGLAVAFFLSAVLFFMSVRHRVLQTASDEYDMPVLLFGGGAVALAILIALACNFLYRSTFASTAVGLAVPLLAVAMLLVCVISPTWEIQSIGHDFGDGQLLSAAALVFLAVLVLTAIAVASSTRFGEVATLLFCGGALELGLVTDYVIGPHVDASLVANVAYHVVPNLGFFWLTDALTQEHAVSAAYVLLVAAYAACYIVAALSVAVALFERREVG